MQTFRHRRAPWCEAMPWGHKTVPRGYKAGKRQYKAVQVGTTQCIGCARQEKAVQGSTIPYEAVPWDYNSTMMAGRACDSLTMAVHGNETACDSLTMAEGPSSHRTRLKGHRQTGPA
eukprot:364971-Chlamydomonas_euryale.AAC.22